MRGRLHLLVGGIWPPQPDVLPDRAGQQNRLLVQDRGLRAQEAKIQIVQAVPVQAHRAGRRIQGPHHQGHQGGLARARRPHEGHVLAGNHRQVHTVQHRATLVGGVHVVEVDHAADPVQHDGVSRGDDVWLDRHEVGHPLTRGRRPGDAAGVLGHVPKRLHGGAQVGREQHQIPRGHGAVQDPDAPTDHHHGGRHADDDVRGALQARGDPA